MKYLGLLVCLCLILNGCASFGGHNSGYRSHLRNGQENLDKKQYGESLKEFSMAINKEEDPAKQMAPTVMIGETYLARNEVRKASKVAVEATTRWPDSFQAWELSGKVKLKQGYLEEAVNDFDKALSLAKKSEDKKRILSPYNLAKGLRFYVLADMQNAEKCFLKITDPKLAREARLRSREILGVSMGS